ncbi:aminopeptidase [Arthrobacter sp. HMWF013]|uniref:aminopeptidase n=1 Tax=Arthrobacter sp. HMWF013 TaxID=2056849 RepID=UPI0015E7F391|nr:aminopeptidase [Arthrobacter sp. HMWF013]
MVLTVEQGADKVTQCATIQKGERVLVLCDEFGDPALSAAVAASARRRGADVKELTVAQTVLSPVADASEFPPGAVDADVLIGATSLSIWHSALGRAAAAAGGRVLAMTGCDVGTLIAGGIEADFDAAGGPCVALTTLLTDARRIRVTTVAGTDLTASLVGRVGGNCTGKVEKPGDRDACPDMEAFIAPLEESVNGRIVIDGSTTSFGLVDEPLEIFVENGRLKEIRGGEQARSMTELLAKHGDSAHVFAEFGFGMNPSARVIGNIVEDEATLGTGHVAFGNNDSFGGANSSTIHQDMVYWRPTIELDGTTVMQDGKLLL